MAKAAKKQPRTEPAARRVVKVKPVRDVPLTEDASSKPIPLPRTVKHMNELTDKLVMQIRNEPVWFCEEILQHKALPGEPTLEENPDLSWELDVFQKELLEACADVWRKIQGIPTRINHTGTNFITARSGHGPGKTHTAALVTHWFNAAFPGRIVATAPKFKQLTTRLWPAFRKVRSRAVPWYRHMMDVNDTTVKWGANLPSAVREHFANWMMLAETATQPENLAGHHETFQLVVVEEASGVPESLVPAILGALSTGALQILFMISNPTKRSGFFAQSHLSPKEADNYFRYHVSLEKARRVKQSWVEKLIRKYGPNNPIVKVRVYGEFPTDDPNQLIATQWIMDAFVRERATDGSHPKLRISIDVADGGDAETIVTAAHHFQNYMLVLKMKAYSFDAHVSPLEAARVAVDMFNAYQGRKGVDDFVPDASGVGAGTAGALIKAGHNVAPHVGGAASSNPKMFRNQRVQNYITLRNDFRDGLILFADDCCDTEDEWEELMAQLCSIRSKPDVERVEDLWTKKEMREEGMKSPDYADSLSMQKSRVTPSLVGGELLGGGAAVVSIPSRALEGFVRG